MSIWGHIAGVIRVDGVNLNLKDENYVLPKEPPVDIGIMTPDYDYIAIDKMSEEEQEVYYAERRRQWQAAKESGIPMGSEGSITWEWLVQKRGEHQYDGCYVISGDLRDFEDAEIVFNWVKKTIEKIKLSSEGIWIRQIAIQVQIDGELPIFISTEYNNKTHTEDLVMYKIAKNTELLYKG